VDRVAMPDAAKGGDAIEEGAASERGSSQKTDRQLLKKHKLVDGSE